jgi:D-lactate dehydrogenase
VAGTVPMVTEPLTASAAAAQAAELPAGEFDAHASCDRTCELGMTRATGRPYVHVLELVERATR